MNKSAKDAVWLRCMKCDISFAKTAIDKLFDIKLFDIERKEQEITIKSDLRKVFGKSFAMCGWNKRSIKLLSLYSKKRVRKILRK